MAEGKAAAPVSGEIFSLSEAKDEAFASETLGKGVVIMPSENVVTAPFDGTIETLFPTNHAIGIKSNDGLEILIHIGIDTVELDGKYFKAHVKQVDYVQAGKKLVTFDREAIEKEGFSTQTMIIVTNTNDYEEVKVLINGNIRAGKELIQVSK